MQNADARHPESGSDEITDLYRETAIVAFRFLGVPDFETFNKMTFYEFNILLEAFRLQQVDKNRDMHWQAFLNYQVTGTKSKGKPVFKTFKKFFDYDKELEKVKGKAKDVDKDERINKITSILYGGS